MKRIGGLIVVLMLAGCAAAPTPPVVVTAPCPQPALPTKPDLSALAALKPSDPPQKVLQVVIDALRRIAADDEALRALLQPPPEEASH